MDEIVVFRALTEAELAKIVEIQLEGLRHRLADRRMTLEVTDAARSYLAKVGYDPVFGARPLKRAILKSLQDPMAEEILAGGYGPGSVVKVDVVGDEFKFEKG